MQQSILTVSELLAQCRHTLETEFAWVQLEGEISNLTKPRSGHWYFILKDAHAQVRCCMFRNANLRVKFAVTDGLQVLVKARVSLYEARGDFQLIAETMEPAGQGRLQQQFEQLKQQLQQQGLFDAAHKRSLPTIVQRLGVITSPSGAAIQDVLSVLKRRFPALPVTLYPSLVQGKEAVAELIHAIQLANQQADCDVLLLTRGGGSLEDLWCFNDPQLAQAIYNSQIPIVSAVGHEIDFTIADFVADLRCATPSAAAETLSPDRQQLLRQLQQLQQSLQHKVQQHLQRQQTALRHVEQRLQLQHPERRLQQAQQRMDELTLRLQQRHKSLLQPAQQGVTTLIERLFRASPQQHIQTTQQKQQQLLQQLQQRFAQQLERKQQRFALAAQQLHTLSPLATLGRGYSLCKTDNTVISSIQQVQPGMTVQTQLQDGVFESLVQRVITEQDDVKATE